MKEKLSPKDVLSGGGEGKEKSPKKKKHSYRRTEIDHHENGSHTVRHIPRNEKTEAGSESPSDMTYAVKDTDELHDGIEEHLGAPNAAEEKAGV